MKKTYEYRAYPTTKQRTTFTVWLALLRQLYNQALAWRIETYKNTGESVKWTTQANVLPDLKQESTSFAGLHSDVLQDTIRRLDKAYKAFFRRIKTRLKVPASSLRKSNPTIQARNAPGAVRLSRKCSL